MHTPTIDQYWGLTEVQGGYIPEIVFHDAIPAEWAALICTVNQDYHTSIEGVCIEHDAEPKLFTSEIYPRETRFYTQGGHTLPNTVRKFANPYSDFDEKQVLSVPANAQYLPPLNDFSTLLFPHQLQFVGKNPSGYMCKIEASKLTFAGNYFLKIENIFSEDSELHKANYIANLNPFVVLYRQEIFHNDVFDLMYVSRMISQSCPISDPLEWKFIK